MPTRINDRVKRARDSSEDHRARGEGSVVRSLARDGEKLFSRTTPRDCTGSSRDDARRSWAGIRLRNEIVVVFLPSLERGRVRLVSRSARFRAQKFVPLGCDRPRRIGNWNACAAFQF